MRNMIIIKYTRVASHIGNKAFCPSATYMNVFMQATVAQSASAIVNTHCHMVQFKKIKKKKRFRSQLEICMQKSFNCNIHTHVAHKRVRSKVPPTPRMGMEGGKTRKKKPKRKKTEKKKREEEKLELIIHWNNIYIVTPFHFVDMRMCRYETVKVNIRTFTDCFWIE